MSSTLIVGKTIIKNTCKVFMSQELCSSLFVCFFKLCGWSLMMLLLAGTFNFFLSDLTATVMRVRSVRPDQFVTEQFNDTLVAPAARS